MNIKLYKPLKQVGLGLLLVLMFFVEVQGQETTAEEPLAIFLTWKEDPTTTISIDWHLKTEQEQTLYYKEKTSMQWLKVESKTHAFPYSDRIIHRAFLNGLNPDTAYSIK